MNRRAPLLALVLALLSVPLAAPLAEAETLDLGDPVVMRAAAVAETPEGLVGATATITVRAATNGSGHVFLDTFPLTQVDMQGSARLASRVASQLVGRPLAQHDFFFVIRSNSEQIGGPSAGAAMTVGAVAALQGWEVRPDALMTGTINPDGSVGPVGGIPEKAQAAAQAGMRTFLFPQGQEVSPLQGDPTRAVDVPRYCREQLGIDCVAVSDVREAVSLMTDHVLERPAPVGDATSAFFQETLAPLSQELVDAAARLVAEADEAVAALETPGVRETLDQRLAAARALLARARDAASNGTHYTAASLSFQASVAAHGIRDVALVAREGEPVLQRALAEAREAVAAARRDVEAAGVDDTSRFESVGAAQDRLLEAEASLAEAETLAGLGGAQNAFEAVETAAFAVERAQTARWWLRLGQGAQAGQPVSREQLEGAARDTLTASKEVVSYVEAVFSAAQAGVTLTDARESLRQADEAMLRGYFPGAMMLALEAETRASALVKLAGYRSAPPESVFEDARRNAAAAIQEARARGVEPLLAQSVYEFSFAQENPVDRLAFLGMARVAANLAGLPGIFADPQPAQSRFQGVPAPVGVPAGWIAAAFAVGLAMGAGVGLAALLPRDEDERVAREVEARAWRGAAEEEEAPPAGWRGPG